jgi:hypothetical protein
MSFFDNLKDFLSNEPSKALGLPTLLSAGQFCMNLLHSLSDGSLSADELQSLINGASGIETIILALAMWLLRKK